MRSPRSRRPRWRLRLSFLAALLAILTTAFYLRRQQRAYDTIGNRSEFTSSACVAYGPTGTDRHVTVFLDPGHGGPDPGASGTAPDGTVLQEKTYTLAVALDAVPILRQDGFRVAVSRIDDSGVAQPSAGSLIAGVYTPRGEHADIGARVDCANAARAKLLLSIHFNSYSDPTVGGAETLYDPARAFSNQSLRFAELVQKSVLTDLTHKGWPETDRGVQPDTVAGTPALTPQGAAYGHLLELGPALPGWFDHPSEMPGALSESLFLTDPGEAAVIESAKGQQVLAHALAGAIQSYLAGKTGR